MGLSMYAYRTKNEITDVDFPFDENDEIFFEWRKHHDLMDILNRWYYQRDGIEDLNVSYMQLTLEDVEYIEENAKNRLEKNSYKNNRWSSEKWHFEQDLLFVEQAKTILANGENIYFSASW